MAKLYAELTSDKGGRKVSKGGDEYINITVSNGNINVFDITFKGDTDKRGYLSIMSYSDGKTRLVEYMPKQS